jgi:hypothetical protein
MDWEIGDGQATRQQRHGRAGDAYMICDHLQGGKSIYTKIDARSAWFVAIFATVCNKNTI